MSEPTTIPGGWQVEVLPPRRGSRVHRVVVRPARAVAHLDVEPWMERARPDLELRSAWRRSADGETIVAEYGPRRGRPPRSQTDPQVKRMLSLPRSVADELDRQAAAAGLTRSDYVASLVREAGS